MCSQGEHSHSGFLMTDHCVNSRQHVWVLDKRDQLLLACEQIKGKHDNYNSIHGRFFCLTTLCQVLILYHCLKQNKVTANNFLVARSGKPSPIFKGYCNHSISKVLKCGWRRLEKISWTDRVKNEEILQRVNEGRNIVQATKRDRVNWIGHDFCLTVHHQLHKVIQMNQLDATMIYWSIRSALNMFRAIFCPSSGAWDWDIYSIWCPVVVVGR